MKLAFLIFTLLAVASCQTWNYTVSNDCSSFICQTNTLRFNNTSVDYDCPRAGPSAKFRSLYGNLFLDLTAYSWYSSDVNFSLPLTVNPNPSNTGVQYFTQISNNTFITILNCTLPAARKASRLCNDHQLVGSKSNGTNFYSGCDFGLDYKY